MTYKGVGGGGIDIVQARLVDDAWYRATYADIGDADPVKHFVEHGWDERRSPNRWMDPTWYHEVYPDVRHAGVNAITHYLEYGLREGRDPGPWFSAASYCSSASTGGEASRSFLDFLVRDESRGAVLRPVKVTFLVHEQERRCFLVNAWRDELQARGFQVDVGHVSSGGPKNMIRSGLLRLGRGTYLDTASVVVSFNGACLDAAALRHLGPSLVLVWDDPEAARAAAARLGALLTMATSVTSSHAVEAILHEAGAGGRTTWYPEPMSDVLAFHPPQARAHDVVWRLPRPPGSKHDALPREAIVCHALGRKVRVVADERWGGAFADEHGEATIEFRSDWNDASLLRDCYRNARLALVTPGAGRETEVTIDTMAALASGALPVLDYAIAPELLALLGADLPVPFYKSLDELEAIVDHYLDAEVEREAYAREGRRRALSLPTYGTRIGSLMRALGHGALASAGA